MMMNRAGEAQEIRAEIVASPTTLTPDAMIATSSSIIHPEDSFIPPFDVASYRMPMEALNEYARWHNRTMADSRACKQANILVWEATAGWGDSVNALTSAFRYALGSSRLFFIEWSSINNLQLWKIGLEQPGFVWDLIDAMTNFQHCEIHRAQVNAPQARRRSSSNNNLALPRILKIAGSIVNDHPLIGSLDRFYTHHPTLPISVLYLLSDSILQDFLLQPNMILRDEWIVPVVRRLEEKNDVVDREIAVVGMQIRSGYADGSEPLSRPSNANFLAPGDEMLFLEKFHEIIQRPPFVFTSGSSGSSGAGGVTRETLRKHPRIFLMTDHPDFIVSIENHIRSRYENSIDLVSLSSPSVSSTTHNLVAPAHCGPNRIVSSNSFLRMLSEWFLFKHHTQFQLITAWSLFGSSAVEGKNENQIWRIDASNCGQSGAKPCQMTRN